MRLMDFKDSKVIRDFKVIKVKGTLGSVAINRWIR